MTTNNDHANGTELDADDLSSRSTTDGSERPAPDGDQTGVDPAFEPGDDAKQDAAVRAELLAEENRRLRTEYTRARKAEYRQTAYALAAIAGLAFLAGLLFPDGREVLFAFGFTGLFGSALTLYLTPKRVVAADVGERVYAAMAANENAVATQLGIDGQHVYLPGTGQPAYLYVPQHSEYDLPERDEGPLVVNEERRGLFIEATGAFLFEAFEQALTGDVASEPAALATQLADGVVEQFELAEAIEPAVDPADGRVTFRVSGSAFGDVDRFDHPLASFLAVGVAVGLDRPVSLEVDDTAEHADWLVTCRWDVDD